MQTRVKNWSGDCAGPARSRPASRAPRAAPEYAEFQPLQRNRHSQRRGGHVRLPIVSRGRTVRIAAAARPARSDWTCRRCAPCSGCRVSPAPRGTRGEARRRRPMRWDRFRATVCCKLLRLTRRYRSKWTATPRRWRASRACATCVSCSTRRRPRTPSTCASRRRCTLHGRSRLGARTTAWTVSWPGRLVPVARCPQRCGLAGWCFERGGRPECACFHEALRDPGGSCVRLTRIASDTALAAVDAMGWCR